MGSKTFLLALVVTALWTTAASASEQVEIPDGDLTLQATLFRPQGDGPFKAVVALHDCSGLDSRPDSISHLYTDWANHLVANGFAVLFPDSFGSRGLGPQCKERKPKIRASRERVTDANAARRWLQTQSYVRADRISLLGWSSGAVATLWAVRPTTTTHDGSTDFRSAVALDPGCSRLRETAWSARVPTLILIGSADDSTLASTCQQMVAGARGRSARAEIVVYPGAEHQFDRANSPVRLHVGLVNSADPSGKAHGGANPAAHSDAFKRVPQWLGR